MGTSGATVLVVDNEPAVAEAYESYLAVDYEVRLAFDGETALDRLDETVDVVLLDRCMPALSGDEVLEHIRSAGYDCQVAMVTAVKPDVDIVEMGFDEYLKKPVSGSTLTDTVSDLLDRRQYDEKLQAYYTSAKKYAALRAESSAADIEDSDEFRRLQDQVTRMSEEVDRAFDRIDTSDATNMTVDRNAPPSS